ncbi:MAG: FHA domain-containing protein [Thermogemmata sp.]|jgi:pSer/pThr/pTyr-binding forkhead associated (FHA) protein|uniref:FHA domain-containing protein n=1 Tax=Thermogemmata fonticola TaxID=2755323 RepID=A0A7V8VC79_9BACT|nr:FHA domain-containing protein [Thermogemmata fonticola]MBA2225373.1 FHA domain-containing protein [Thermogemmata fonticola]MCX8138779.1 FHA domain-containing protein [Gemmataceae bacterium]GIW84771.1 MAG: peptide-binding protein [Gemmataceae bacterium]
MRKVTFLVLEGVDKGRVFRDLPIPVTIGREEGNSLRLNDERVSRFHAKVQMEDDDIIITDLDSTNGTRVNGMPIQIRRLRAGDQICVGRTIILFGSMEEIAARRAEKMDRSGPSSRRTASKEEIAAQKSAVIPASTRPREPTIKVDDSFPVAPRIDNDDPTVGHTAHLPWCPLDDEIPPLPLKLTPAQVARLVEIFDYLHRGLTLAVENIDANEDGTEVRLGFGEWQTIQAVQMLLARYSRALTEPEE